jgi:predicted nucleic acid-binding protein
MNACFADTSYYIALVNPGDEAHGAASDYTAAFDGSVVTTDWVLVELANFLADPPNRGLFLEILSDLRGDPRVTIIAADPPLFDRGVELYAGRADKAWSLTDCISFVVMRDRRTRRSAHHRPPLRAGRLSGVAGVARPGCPFSARSNGFSEPAAWTRRILAAARPSGTLGARQFPEERFDAGAANLVEW